MISRREFLRLTGYGTMGAFLPLGRLGSQTIFPEAERLGRVIQQGLELKLRPDPESSTLGQIDEDTVVQWLREVVGPPPKYQLLWRWVETPDGFLHASYVQPVRNQPQESILTLPQHENGEGMWVDVTIPYVEVQLANPPARSPWLRAAIEQNKPPRLYYSQILWVDQIQVTNEGNVLYRINEPYGSYGDIFWGEAAAFRPVHEEEFSPINPEVTDKRVIVDSAQQTLSCYEGQTEVFYCRASTGVPFDAKGEPLERSSTPLGPHRIWRKLISTHMSGGTTGGGWDLPGIGWTTLFIGSGVAVHSTFWHNNFGAMMSRGCVNVAPEDAKWVFRWTTPEVPYYPGDVTVSMPGGTVIEVVEG